MVNLLAAIHSLRGKDATGSSVIVWASECKAGGEGGGGGGGGKVLGGRARYRLGTWPRESHTHFLSCVVCILVRLCESPECAMYDHPTLHRQYVCVCILEHGSLTSSLLKRREVRSHRSMTRTLINNIHIYIYSVQNMCTSTSTSVPATGTMQVYIKIPICRIAVPSPPQTPRRITPYQKYGVSIPTGGEPRFV